MAFDLNPEREEELIDQLGELIVKNNMEMLGLLFLESARPITNIGSQLLYYFVAPFTSLTGNWTEDMLALFYKRENVDRLIKKINKLSVEKRKLEDNSEEGWKGKLKRFFSKRP